MKKLTDEEMMIKIDDVIANFKGQLDDLQAAVGMVMIGRLYGWRVVRLISSNRHWRFACETFGDLKEFLPERGVYAHKSVGLKVVDATGDYWNLITGKGNREALPLHQRKAVI